MRVGSGSLGVLCLSNTQCYLVTVAVACGTAVGRCPCDPRCLIAFEDREIPVSSHKWLLAGVRTSNLDHGHGEHRLINPADLLEMLHVAHFNALGLASRCQLVPFDPTDASWIMSLV